MKVGYLERLYQTRRWLRRLPRTTYHLLEPRYRRLLEARFGLDDEDPRTLASVARKFRLTRERVRQVTEEALRRLRYGVAVYKRWRDRQTWMVPLEWLPLSPRARRALVHLRRLHRNCCRDLRALARHARLEELFRVRNCGAITLYEIHSRLRQLGLPLRASRVAVWRLRRRLRRFHRESLRRLERPIFAPSSYRQA